MVKERNAFSLPGLPIAVACIAAGIALIAWLAWFVWSLIETETFDPLIFAPVLVAIPVVIVAAGLTVVNPNEARAIVFLGHYAGTVRRQGFWWVNPFTLRPKISVRIRNFETGKLKVQALRGLTLDVHEGDFMALVGPSGSGKTTLLNQRRKSGSCRPCTGRRTGTCPLFSGTKSPLQHHPEPVQ